MANGNFSSLMDTLPGEVRYAEPIQLFRNLGDRTFGDVSDAAGLNQGQLKSRRGTAFGDINNDGNLDVVVFNVGEPPSLFINETVNSNHRVLFRLIGTKSNRAAVGARLAVTTSTMIRFRRSPRRRQLQFDQRLAPAFRSRQRRHNEQSRSPFAERSRGRSLAISTQTTSTKSGKARPPSQSPRSPMKEPQIVAHLPQ